MKYTKTVELLQEILEERGGTVPLTTFYNTIAREMNTSDEPSLKRTIKSMKFLKLIDIDSVNAKVLINPRVMELDV